jgi:hypothetical protein
MPGRTLRLVSPELRGLDVKHLQEGLVHLGYKLKVDGVYDRETDHAVQQADYRLGLDSHKAASVGVQEYIEHPLLRTPKELARAHERKLHPAPNGATGLAAIVAHAQSYIGVHEVPPSSNWGLPYPAKWEENFGAHSGEPWCGAFAGSMILLAGGHPADGVVYVPNIEAYARSKTGGFEEWQSDHRNGVGPGWLVVYQFPGFDVPDHVGIVEELHPDYLVTVEGNTSGDNPADGGMVDRMTRSYSPTVGYAKPRLLLAA